MAGESKSIVAAVAEVNDLKDAIGDLKKEIDEALSSLNNFGRVGSLSVRNLGVEARSLQSTFRDLSREFRRLSTPAGTIGAAATSQALGTLTGGGRGGGGGGGGGVGGGTGMLGGVSGLGGAIGHAVGQAGGLLSATLGAIVGTRSPGLGRIIAKTGRFLSSGAAIAATAGLQGGMGFIEGAMGQQLGLEKAGRGYLGWTRMLPKSEQPYATAQDAFNRAEKGVGHNLSQAMSRGARFGFNAQEQIEATMSMLPFAGAGKEGRKAMERFVPGVLQPFATGAGLGVGEGPLQQVTAAMRAGGRSLQDVEDIFGAGVKTLGQGNARQSLSLLDSIKGSIGQLVNITGKATQEQIEGTIALHRGLSKTTDFAPEVLPGIIKQLQGAAMQPGGGEAGMVAMLQTMGFGMPDLRRQQALAASMGIKNPERYGVARNYLDAQLAMEDLGGNPARAGEMALLTARKLGGGVPQYEAKVLQQLAPGMGFRKALNIVQAGAGGGLLKELGEKVLKLDKGAAGLEGLPETATLKKQLKLINEQTRMVNMQLGLDRDKLVDIAKAVTKVKIALVGLSSDIILKLPEQIGAAFDAIAKGIETIKGAGGGGGRRLKVFSPRTWHLPW